SHGLGNDYLVIDPTWIPFDLTPAAVQLICHRNFGVGSDGILALTSPGDGDFGMRVLNPDGSEAEKSGNGVRIFAKFCLDHGYVDPSKSVKIHTLGGPVEAFLVAREKNRTVLRVSMGKVSFRCADLPMTGPMSESGEWI